MYMYGNDIYVGIACIYVYVGMCLCTGMCMYMYIYVYTGGPPGWPCSGPPEQNVNQNPDVIS